MDTKYLEIIKAPKKKKKSAHLAQEEGKYLFKVDPKATKTEVKNAVEKIFKVKVESVSTITIKPKKRRVGRYAGLSNRAKKAIVKLAEGQTIDLG